MMRNYVSLLLSLLLILCFVSNSYAEGELPAPVNVGWKEGSTATAQWDAVDGADYYQVHVFVYHDGEEIGNTVTGTADTEIDVQAEINSVVRDVYPTVRVR